MEWSRSFASSDVGGDVLKDANEDLMDETGLTSAPFQDGNSLVENVRIVLVSHVGPPVVGTSDVKFDRTGYQGSVSSVRDARR
jgi:hypothetical protein